MKTVYVDVYFLVNFTVDILSCFFASRITHIKTSTRRIVLIGALGGAVSVLELFIQLGVFYSFIISVLFLLISSRIVSPKTKAIGRLRFLITFLFIQTAVGGAVYFIHGLLDKYKDVLFSEVQTKVENRRALIFAVIILLLIGVIRLVMLLFANSGCVKTAKLGLHIGELYFECDALVDTGNLVKDPMNMSPVMFIKPDLASKYLPNNIIELKELDELDRGLRKRIRLIPVSVGGQTHVLTGVRADYACLLDAGGERVDITLAIDKEGGTFGGYEALAPAAVFGYGIQ